jgi:PTH1 family peptidyl-tRNA hydrolase
MIKLVVFLGNPGAEYERNRHNVGRLFFTENLSAALSLPVLPRMQKKFSGLYTSILPEQINMAQRNGEKAHILIPETFMNLSGKSAALCAAFYKIKPEEILACHDELELPLGTVSFKWSGGLGGHNGLRSLKAELGSADFWRLRIGIGRPAHSDVALWVLSDFTPDERITLSRVFSALEAPFLAALESGAEALLPEWGKKIV